MCVCVCISIYLSVCLYQPVHIDAHMYMQVMESYAFDYLDAPMERVAGADVPMPYANNLEQAAIPTAANIVSAARRACYRKPA